MVMSYLQDSKCCWMTSRYLLQWTLQHFDAEQLQTYWSVVYATWLIVASCAAGEELAG